MIDVLTSVVGVGASELVASSIRIEAIQNERSLRMIRPLLSLESKLVCLRQLDQSTRQDLKHVRLMVTVMAEHMHHQLDRPRELFRTIERYHQLRLMPVAQHASRFGVDLWAAVPLAAMRGTPEYRVFFERRLPQMERQADELDR